MGAEKIPHLLDTAMNFPLGKGSYYRIKKKQAKIINSWYLLVTDEINEPYM